MNTKNWLIFFLGAISATVVGLIIYLFTGENVELKDILPSLITGVVTFAALFFTYWNNKEQREVMLKTTIEKEWIKDVRNCISITIETLSFFAVSRIDKINDESQTFDEAFYLKVLEKSVSNTALLGLLLNNKNKLESDLLNAILAFNKQIHNVKKGQNFNHLVDDGQKIIDAAQALFDSFK